MSVSGSSCTLFHTWFSLSCFLHFLFPLMTIYLTADRSRTPPILMVVAKFPYASKSVHISWDLITLTNRIEEPLYQWNQQSLPFYHHHFPLRNTCLISETTLVLPFLRLFLKKMTLQDMWMLPVASKYQRWLLNREDESYGWLWYHLPPSIGFTPDSTFNWCQITVGCKRQLWDRLGSTHSRMDLVHGRALQLSFSDRSSHPWGDQPSAVLERRCCSLRCKIERQLVKKNYLWARQMSRIPYFAASEIQWLPFSRLTDE